MKSILLILLIVVSVYAEYISSENYRYYSNITSEQALEDFRKGDIAKYQNDDIAIISTDALIKSGVIASADDLNASADETIDCYLNENSNYTATIFDINFEQGKVTCMYSLKRHSHLHMPQGLFVKNYTHMKENFKVDFAKSEEINKNHIKNADQQFEGLYAIKREIFNSTEKGSQEYLTVPELLLSTMLSDTDIIDVEETAANGKLQLKDNFTSTIFNSDGTYESNSQYILADAENIFITYKFLSDISINYLAIITSFMLIYGFGSTLFKRLNDKNEDAKIKPWLAGIFAGVLLFFPVNDTTDAELESEYGILKNKYQEFELEGFKLFSEWADDVAKAMIENELNSLIKKSGIGTKDQIINSYAFMKKHEKLASNYINMYDNACSDSYDIDYLKTQSLTDDKNTFFTKSEKLLRFNQLTHKTMFWYSKGLETKNNYPLISISACNRMYYSQFLHSQKRKEFEDNYNHLIRSSDSDTSKIAMLEQLVQFQYELYREFGYLAILGLPITKMQTEMIGGLYEKDTQIISELNEKIATSESGKFFHSMMSSIPYMFVPGANTVYRSVTGTVRDFKSGAMNSGVGWAAKLFGGGAVASVVASSAGFSLSYVISKTILALTPIVGLFIFGLIRWIIIMMKILVFHFSSLFFLPLMFVQNNLKRISSFSIKIIVLMLEIPLFVLSIWLAMTASSLINSIGDIFSKKIMIGMIKNNELQANNEFSFEKIFELNFEMINYVKIYFFDGMLEVSLALFSIVVLYKIIATMHTAVIELFEMKGSQALDNTIESMQNQNANWGSRI